MRIVALQILTLYTLMLAGGCATKGVDPYEKTNRFFYGVNDGLDHLIVKPVSDLYVKIIPSPVRTGLGNAFGNLGYGNVIFNDYLQGKLHQGFSDLCRMAVNSTVGVAGIFDVATAWKIPAHQNDFGITLAHWGSKPGPYLVLPVLGPSTFRDAPGWGVALATNPLTYVDAPWEATVPVSATAFIDARSRGEVFIRFRNEAAIDPYVFTRDAYLQYRNNLINEGHPPPDQNLYDIDDNNPTTQPSTQPTTQISPVALHSP